jgi:hypothetical protein
MALRVDARDVLDPNARTRRSFAGRIVGRFRRGGPNAWDDYVYEAEEGGPVDVLPGLPIQLEPRGVEFRLRRRGQVVRVAWQPPPEVLAEVGSDARALRRRFLDGWVEGFAEEAGQGPAAMIVRKLRE